MSRKWSEDDAEERERVPFKVSVLLTVKAYFSKATIIAILGNAKSRSLSRPFRAAIIIASLRLLQ